MRDAEADAWRYRYGSEDAERVNAEPLEEREAKSVDWLLEAVICSGGWWCERVAEAIDVAADGGVCRSPALPMGLFLPLVVVLCKRCANRGDR